MRSFTALAAALVLPLPALAATPRVAVLDVQNMTCALCPVTVKKSLQDVPGVTQAKVDLDKKTATVTFDADKTSAASLIKATTDARLPFNGPEMNDASSGIAVRTDLPSMRARQTRDHAAGCLPVLL